MGATYRYTGISHSLEMDKKRPFFVYMPIPEGVRREQILIPKNEKNNFTATKCSDFSSLQCKFTRTSSV